MDRIREIIDIKYHKQQGAEDTTLRDSRSYGKKTGKFAIDGYLLLLGKL